MFFKKRRQLIKDQSLDELFNERGLIKFGKLDPKLINELAKVYEKLSIPDSYGLGFNVGFNTVEENTRKIMQDEISSLLEDVIPEYFINREVNTATFMNKVSGKNFFLPPHQDWTYTDEKVDDSVMCWIPLVDVNKDNGALCYMPKSHKLFSNTRGFPLPYMPTSVNKLKYELLPYMQIIEAKAGEMILINHKTAHASLPNTTLNERVSVGISLNPKDKSIIVKCLNPLNKGKSLITYEVDKYFIVNNRHTELAACFDNNKAYNFDYRNIKEEKYFMKNISLSKIERFYKKNKIIVSSNLDRNNYDI